MIGYMGIDIGTSGCKAAVFDENGKQLSLAYREYDLIVRNKGWAELDSDNVIEKCFEVIKEAAGNCGAEKIAGLGISSQGEAFTPIDKDGRALYNAIVSSDSRAAEYVHSWPKQFGKEKLYRITGHTSHSLFSLFKLLWLRDNEPEIFNSADKFLCFEDLLQYRLGLEPAMGYPMAGRTMLFDVTGHCWSTEILESIGLDKSKFANPMPSGSLAGNVSGKVAKKIGLSEGTFVLTGGHDQPCCALGAGAITPGKAVYSIGTVECITPAFDSPVFSDELRKNNLCTYDHAVKGTYATVAYSITGANMFKWCRDELGQPEIEEARNKNINAYELILEHLDEEPTDLLALPYFTPSGTPYFETDIKGMIYGLTLSTKRTEIIKAMLEAVTMEIKLNLDILKNSGCEVNELRAIGGGAKSSKWVQLKADILGLPISILDVKEAGCFGMAMLACSYDRKIPVADIANRWVTVVSKKHPRPQFSEIYEQKFRQYKKLYPMLKESQFLYRDLETSSSSPR
ncbi:MAG: L-fuculokinase [Sedimentisphaeraceae bacterium JB056]